MGVKHQAKVHKKDPCIGPLLVKVLENIMQSRVDYIIH